MPAQAFAVDVVELAGPVAAQVFRTDLELPGFAHRDLGAEGTPSAFRQLLVSLGQALAAAYRQGFVRPLGFFSLGRFDQQVSTEAHRDGAPEESILILGYEPTSVASRLFILDYSRAARDRGLRPADFLERYNPLTAAGREALAASTVELSGFDPGRYHVVVINNSALPLELRQRGMLGVLHKAVIPRPDAAASRYVNSLILAPPAEGSPTRISPEQEEAFIESATTAVG